MEKPHQYKASGSSAYGAPKFKQVGDVRRERYVNNFMTTQAMDEQQASVIAAPFELDQQYRQNLLQTTDAQIKDFGERGDFENMTVDIYRASTDFNKKKEPLAKNLAAYTAYQEGLEKLYNDGDIDSEDKDGTMLLSRQGYQGLSFDESGQANYFRGVEAVHNPDIDALLDKAIGNIEKEEYDYQRSNEGNQLGAGEDGAFTVRQKSSVSQHQSGRSPERVAAVFDNVMRRPDVMAYLNRKSEIHAAQMQGKEGEYLSETSKNVDEALVGLDAAIAEETDSDKAAMLEAQRGQLEEMKAEIAEAMEDPEEASKLMQELDKNHRIQEYKDQYLTSYGLMNTTVDKQSTSTILGYDKVWLQNEKLRKKFKQQFELQTPAITISNETMTYTDALGGTYEDAKNTIKSVDASMMDMRENLDRTDISAGTRKMYENQYNNFAALRASYLERFTQEFENMSPEMLDNPEYLRLKNNVENAKSRGIENTGSEDGFGGAFASGVESASPQGGIASIIALGMWAGVKSWFSDDPSDHTGSSLKSPEQQMLEFMEGNGLSSDAFNLSTGGSVDYAPTVTMDRMPGLDQKKQAAFRNALNGLFTGGMSGASDLMVYAPKGDGEMQTITNSTEDMVTINDIRDDGNLPADASMKSYGVIAVNPMGAAPMIKVNWTSKDEGKTGSLYVPIQQGSLMNLGDGGVAQYLDSSYISFMTSIEGGQWNKKNTATIPYHTEKLDETTGLYVDAPEGKGAIHVKYERNEDGSVKKKMARFISDSGIKSEEYDVLSPDFESILMNGDGGSRIVPDTNY